MSEPVMEADGIKTASATVAADLISVVRPDPRSVIVMVTVVLKVFGNEKWFTGRIDLGKRIFIDHPDHQTEHLFHAATLLLGPAVTALVAVTPPLLIVPIPQKDP